MRGARMDAQRWWRWTLTKHETATYGVPVLLNYLEGGTPTVQCTRVVKFYLQ